MNYIITEERLSELLEAEFDLTALSNMGVDNWSGYECAFDEVGEFDSIAELKGFEQIILKEEGK